MINRIMKIYQRFAEVVNGIIEIQLIYWTSNNVLT